jgi:hypothetical protein
MQFHDFCQFLCITQILVGGGRGDRPAQQIQCLFKAKIRLFIQQLLASQTSESFSPEV